MFQYNWEDFFLSPQNILEDTENYIYTPNLKCPFSYVFQWNPCKIKKL